MNVELYQNHCGMVLEYIIAGLRHNNKPYAFVSGDFLNNDYNNIKNAIKVLPKEYTIIDPFMSDGSVGVASVKLSRDFIGIESNQLSFDIAEQRIFGAKHAME